MNKGGKMKLVYLLVVLSGGNEVRMEQDVYFARLSHCTRTARALRRQGYNRHDWRRKELGVNAKCLPVWVKQTKNPRLYRGFRLRRGWDSNPRRGYKPLTPLAGDISSVT